jgi:predicted anti-sigma-YlaC factor YlaD
MDGFKPHQPLEHIISYRLSFISVLTILSLLLTTGCSAKKFVAKRAGNVFANSGTVYASDNDVELVGSAIPFGLKTMESLLAEVPEHHELLIATARGFTQYAYAYVALPAFEAEESDRRRSRELRKRAKRLYIRGRDYAVRALELNYPGFVANLRQDAHAMLASLKAKHVPELYWAAVSWSAAISMDKQDMDLVADLHLIEPMIRRCLALDDEFDNGAIHDFMITFEASRSRAQGGSAEEARRHFERAMALADGQRIAPLVSLAESVSVRAQDRKEFRALLQQALSFDVDSAPDHRLANLIAQKRAELLMSRVDDLFIGE